MFGYKDTRTAAERDLQDELDQMREMEEQRIQRERRECVRRREEERQEREYEMRTAVDWPDALYKHMALCQREINDGGDEEIDNFFANSLESAKVALEIWRDVSAEKQPEIDALEAQITAIIDSIRHQVADRLLTSDHRHEFAMLAQQMHDLQDSEVSSFLDW
jgi:hypothetical protein